MTGDSLSHSERLKDFFPVGCEEPSISKIVLVDMTQGLGHILGTKQRRVNLRELLSQWTYTDWANFYVRSLSLRLLWLWLKDMD